MRSWVIGSSADCDIVVDSPLASGRHCELTQDADDYVLKDLGSTNGTYVNGLRITSPTRVSTGDSITLGRTVPLPWPSELTKYVSIGRLADNDIVLDDVRVSGHHARLIVVAGSQTSIEDIGSSNGTFLNSADRRVTGPTRISESDTVYFGTLAVPAARLLAEVKQIVTAASSQPAITPHRADSAGCPVAVGRCFLEGNSLVAGVVDPGADCCDFHRVDLRPTGGSSSHGGELGLGRAGDRVDGLLSGGCNDLDGLLSGGRGSRDRSVAVSSRAFRIGGIFGAVRQQTGHPRFALRRAVLCCLRSFTWGLDSKDPGRQCGASS